MTSPLAPAAAPGAPDASTEQRKAALVIHAMPPDDRSWLLDQLPPADRDLLERLLVDLRELGIPADRQLLQEVLSAPASPQPAAPDPVPAPTGAAADHAAIERAGARVLWRVLSDEPSGLIIRVLIVLECSWEREFLDQIPIGRRLVVERRLSDARHGGGAQTKMPELLRTHLLAKLAARIGEAERRSTVDQLLVPGRLSGRLSGRPDGSLLWWKRQPAKDQFLEAAE